MKNAKSKLVSLALCLPLILAATPAGQEHLVSRPLPTFVVGYDAGNEQVAIREEVPAGETVEDWTRMVTTQRFAGIAARVTPLQLLERMSQQLATSCPGATTSQPESLVRSGRPAAQFRADCPLLAQTGKPETFIVLAISGLTDLHVKQVAFRRVPTGEDIRWGEDILASVAFCGAGEAGGDCAR